MIRSIEIEGLRGIRQGKLDELPPLAILVGPNGSGKSTVLAGLLIASHANPHAGVKEVVASISSRVTTPRPARWLLWRGGDEGPSTIRVSSYAPEDRACQLSIDKRSASITCIPLPAGRGGAPDRDGEERRRITRGPNGGRGSAGFAPLGDVPEVRYLDAQLFGKQQALDDLYTRVVEQGRREEANEIVTGVVPGAKNIEILTDQGKPVVHLVFKEYSVPAALAGDGVLMVLRLVLQLASRPKGVVLLEEPEVHQHPGAIRQSAKAILAAVRRDIQVILTTHSLELIDALIAEADDEDLNKTALFRLNLEDGVLKSSRLAGPDVKFARTRIEDDLR